MCSTISLRPCEQREAILAALATVAEESLFTFADASCREDHDAALAAGPWAEGWLQARVGFDGPASGSFDVHVPASLARRLCCAFAGTDSEDEATDADVEDFLGEVANMVCGLWLTRTVPHAAFALSRPLVETTATAAGDRADSLEGETWYATLDDVPCRVGLSRSTALVTGEAHADGR